MLESAWFGVKPVLNGILNSKFIYQQNSYWDILFTSWNHCRISGKSMSGYVTMSVQGSCKRIQIWYFSHFARKRPNLGIRFHAGYIKSQCLSELRRISVIPTNSWSRQYWIYIIKLHYCIRFMPDILCCIFMWVEQNEWTSLPFLKKTMPYIRFYAGYTMS